MNYPLLSAVIGILLVACSERPSGKAAIPTATTAPSYLKATTVRPTAIKSTVSLPDVCWLDSVNDQPAKDASISDKARVKLTGWAGNIPAGTSPKQVYVEIEGPSTVYVQAALGIRRPDVAEAYKKAGLADTGWVAYADMSELAAGIYKVRIIQVEEQSSLSCDTKNSILIK